MQPRSFRRATLTALVFTALAGAAMAQTPPPPEPGGPRANPPHVNQQPHRPDRRAAMRARWNSGGMLHMLGLAEMRPGMKIEFSEGRLAFLKAELKIADAQAKAWDDFAAALRENAAKLNEAFGTPDREARAKMTLAERLAWREKTIGAQFDAAKRARATFEPLHATFSDDQKKTFDRLVPTGPRFAASRERMRQRMEQRRRQQPGQPPAQPDQPPRQR